MLLIHISSTLFFFKFLIYKKWIFVTRYRQRIRLTQPTCAHYSPVCTSLVHFINVINTPWPCCYYCAATTKFVKSSFRKIATVSDSYCEEQSVSYNTITSGYQWPTELTIFLLTCCSWWYSRTTHDVRVCRKSAILEVQQNYNHRWLKYEGRPIELSVAPNCPRTPPPKRSSSSLAINHNSNILLRMIQQNK